MSSKLIYASTFLCNLLFCKYAKIISDCFAIAHPIISINIECDNKQNIKTNPVLKKLYEVCLFNYHKDSQHTAVSIKYCVNLFKVYNRFNTARKCEYFFDFFGKSDFQWWRKTRYISLLLAFLVPK